MKTTPISPDDTHIKNVANPSGLKKASGDSSAGVDAATLNAVLANLVANGMIDLSAIQMMERSSLSHLNNNNITSLSESKKTEKRSEKINELALGMNTSQFQSARVNSLGDIMCELMVLMIQSTSERRQMEREMQTILVVAQMNQSNQLAEEILKKMELDVAQIKTEAWGQVALAVGSAAITKGMSAGKKGTVSGEKMSFQDVQKGFNRAGSASSFFQQVGGAAITLVNASSAKEVSRLEAKIQRQQTVLATIKSIADSVGSSLKSIDSTRDHFMSIMTQIAQAAHDNKMQIIRNSVV
ncbi:MAG: hypothetical protein LBB11_00825 [Puniceicoccales bacterium]|jgi:hypothetical protein|nr:hypothetical protein [Puniceicoccales bacterium]